MYVLNDLLFWRYKEQREQLQIATTDMRNFARSEASSTLVHKKSFG